MLFALHERSDEEGQQRGGLRSGAGVRKSGDLEETLAGAGICRRSGGSPRNIQTPTAGDKAKDRLGPFKHQPPGTG